MSSSARWLTSIVFCLFVLLSLEAYAEPWQAVRFAENCSSCHSGGRLNVPSKEQRCTTSCQACHVSPNGGGLRNGYGQWNQQRWLKSFHTKGAIRTDKPTPLPPKDQDYIRRAAQHFLEGTAEDAEREPAQARRQTGASETKGKYAWAFPASEAAYGPTADVSHRTTASNADAYLARIPKEDPYYLDKEFVTVGMDFKFVYRALGGEIGGLELPDEDRVENYVSQVDLSVRFRPFKEKFSLVLEPRFYNTPDGSALENAFTTGAIVKSAYGIFDALPYNSYFQAGIYSPMFGYGHPDENTNINRMISQNTDGARTIGAINYNYFKSVGAGFASRHSFLNLNYVQPTNDEAANAGSETLDSKEAGIVGTIGVREVKSFSSWLSYWSSENPDLDRKRTMYSWVLGTRYRRLVTHLEAFGIENVATTSGFKNSGTTYAIDNRFRFWRENYFKVYYSTSNTALDLSEGSSSETMYGIKSYIVTGLDVELLLINRKEEKESAPAAPTNAAVTQLLLHYYF